MEHPPKPPSLEDRVQQLAARVEFLEHRLNNWINTKDEQRHRQRAVSAPQVTPRLFASKYDGACATCGEPYYATEPIHWTKVNGKSICWHKDCDAPPSVAR